MQLYVYDDERSPLMDSQESGVVPFTIYRSTAAVPVHGKYTHHQARFGRACIWSGESYRKLLDSANICIWQCRSVDQMRHNTATADLSGGMAVLAIPFFLNRDPLCGALVGDVLILSIYKLASLQSHT